MKPFLTEMNGMVEVCHRYADTPLLFFLRSAFHILYSCFARTHACSTQPRGIFLRAVSCVPPLFYLPGMPSRSHLDTAGREKFPHIIGPAFRAGQFDRIHLLYAQDFVKSMFTLIALEFVQRHGLSSLWKFTVSGFIHRR